MRISGLVILEIIKVSVRTTLILSFCANVLIKFTYSDLELLSNQTFLLICFVIAQQILRSRKLFCGLRNNLQNNN